MTSSTVEGTISQRLPAGAHNLVDRDEHERRSRANRPLRSLPLSRRAKNQLISFSQEAAATASESARRVKTLDRWVLYSTDP